MKKKRICYYKKGVLVCEDDKKKTNKIESGTIKIDFSPSKRLKKISVC